MKAAFASYVSWVRVRRENAEWASGTKGDKQNKWETKIYL